MDGGDGEGRCPEAQPAQRFGSCLGRCLVPPQKRMPCSILEPVLVLILLLLMLVMLMPVLLLAGWQITVCGGGRCGGGGRAYTFLTCAYQAGTKLEPNGTNLETAWHQAGKSLEPSWNQAGNICNQPGTKLNPGWNQAVSRLVPNCF